MVGNAFTVTATSAWQPEALVYVMDATPGATPVTKPVAETVATAVLADCHGLTAAAAPEPVSWVVRVGQIEVDPVTIGIGNWAEIAKEILAGEGHEAFDVMTV